MEKKGELLFIYNANSGILAAITDSAHKLVSRKTYSCKLCALTYGIVSMKQDWRQFVKNLPMRVTFLHKDEFVLSYPSYAATSYPVIFKKENEELKVFISADEINKQKNLSQLKELIREKIS